MVQLNPNPKVVREKDYLYTIAKIVGQVLQHDDGSLPLNEHGVSAAYHPQDGRLCLSAIRDDEDELIRQLKGLLCEQFGPDAADLEESLPSSAGRSGKCNLLINHHILPRFLNEVCHAVSLYNSGNYSLVRDFYGVAPEGGLRFFDVLSDAVKNNLRAVFEEQHKAYRACEKTQTNAYALAHWANGAIMTASFFKRVHHSASSEDELYQRLNALIHTYHLRECRVGEKISPAFQDRMTAKDEHARVADVHGEDQKNGVLTLVHSGDMFFEISQHFKDNPGVRMAYVSPDNLFRCGSAALTGNRGTVEECLVRVSDYVPRALEDANLHKDDPQLVLRHLYQNLQPTGNTLTLGGACGVYYLTGQTIPEYIPRADARAYSEFAYERLHLAREMANKQEAGYEDRYPQHKQQPHLVRSVRFLDAQGVVREVDVLGMVGINGKVRRANSKASQVSFDDSDLQDQHGRNEQGQFDFNKTKTFYCEQWCQAFEVVLSAQPRINVFMLNPVGCGAFDPSKNGETYTKASAEGFAAALARYRESLKNANIKLVLPVYDMAKVWGRYKESIDLELSDDEPSSQVVLGGTRESCHAAICKAYRELGGKDFDIEHKSLEEILAHAMQKDRKTREALIKIGYFALKAGVLVMGPLAPQVLHHAFVSLKKDTPEYIKELIIEAYKAERGWFYKNSQSRREAFDIYSATLEEIFAHAREKGGNTRNALMMLKYVQLDCVNNRLVLNDDGDEIILTQVVKDAFHASDARFPEPAAQRPSIGV